jgi:hypothetical protein
MRELIIAVIITFFVSGNCYSQSWFKKMILDDLYLTNQVYDYAIIDTSTSYILGTNEEQKGREITYDEFALYYDQIVEIIHIDSFGSLYQIQVNFKLLDFNCLKSNAKTLPILNYTVISSGEKYYEISGFLFSKINQVDLDDIRDLSNLPTCELNVKKLLKGLKRRDHGMIAAQLEVSILKSFSCLIDDEMLFEPFIISLELEDCESR